MCPPYEHMTKNLKILTAPETDFKSILNLGGVRPLWFSALHIALAIYKHSMSHVCISLQ